MVSEGHTIGAAGMIVGLVFSMALLFYGGRLERQLSFVRCAVAGACVATLALLIVLDVALLEAFKLSGFPVSSSLPRQSVLAVVFMTCGAAVGILARMKVWRAHAPVSSAILACVGSSALLVRLTTLSPALILAIALLLASVTAVLMIKWRRSTIIVGSAMAGAALVARLLQVFYYLPASWTFAIGLFALAIGCAVQIREASVRQVARGGLDD